MRSEAEIREKLARLQRRHNYAVEHHHFVTVTSTTAALALARWILEEKDIPVPEEKSGCELCGDSGIVGGALDIPWQWCTCELGLSKQVESPGLVSESNLKRERLLLLASSQVSSSRQVVCARQSGVGGMRK